MYICQELVVVCVYVFLCAYGGMYVYMSERVYVFMYLYACKSDESEREVLGGRQFDCLEEGCYLSPRSNNFMSYKQILTFSVVKLMFLSCKQWQAKFHNRRQQQIFDVLSTFF